MEEAIAYTLSAGLLKQKRTIRLTSNYLEYETGGAGRFTRICKEEMCDIKHSMEWIYWYRFWVGCDFRIEIKTKSQGICKLQFVSYFGQNSAYQKIYARIVDRMWTYYLNDMVNAQLQELAKVPAMDIGGLKLSIGGVGFDEQAPLTPWQQVGVKEYDSYYAVYDQDNPALHKRIEVDAWGSELLFGMIAALKEAKCKE